MNYKHILLVGGLLLATSLTADAQRRGWSRGGNFGGVSFGVGVGPSWGGYNNFGYGGFNNFGYSPYGYNNFGYGRGTGFGVGIGNSPYYYGGSPYYGRSYYSTPSYYNTPTYSYSTPTYSYSTPGTTYVTPQYVTPATYSTPGTAALPAGSEWGLRITELPAGNAKTAGLEMGDVILKADGKRTQTFDDLRNVLSSTSKKVVEIEYVDAASGRTQVQNVAVSDTKIGVTVEETPVTVR